MLAVGFLFSLGLVTPFANGRGPFSVRRPRYRDGTPSVGFALGADRRDAQGAATRPHSGPVLRNNAFVQEYIR